MKISFNLKVGENVNYETLKMIKDEISIDVATNSPRIYQSIRSLTEYVIREFYKIKNDEMLKDNSRIELSKLLLKLENYYKVDFDFGFFKKNVLHLRNLKEHEPEKIKKAVDHKEVKTCILAFNELVIALNKVENNISLGICINEDIFYKSFNFGVVKEKRIKTPYEQSLEEFKATLDVKRLKEKLNELEKEKQIKGVKKYDIQSDIIAIKNRIKRSDKVLIDLYSNSEPYERKPIIDLHEEDIFNIGAYENDYGFKVVGIQKNRVCRNRYASIYAIIFNFLQRGKAYKPSMFLRKKEEQNGVFFNYKNILRYQILILMMIKNNYFNNGRFEVNLIDGKEQELIFAIEDIINYACIISRLAKIDYIKPDILIVGNGVKLSLENNEVVDECITCIDNTTLKVRFTKSLWIEDSLRYNIENNDKELLEVLLNDFFGFKKFKDGQYEALTKILNSYKGSMCVMPTGAGKSILFYMESLLKSSTSIVISPTKLLIKDQIRNLKEVHNINDATEIEECYNYANYTPNNNLLYVTPEVFLNYSFINRISQLNIEGRINTIILDEVHCMSHWSHDYRPSYLMLSKYILKYMSRIKIIGFTATTNFKITKDILHQLNFNKKDIIQPISLRRSDISINFKSYESDFDLINALQIDLEAERAHTLIFTKGDVAARFLYNNFNSKTKERCDLYCDNLDGFYYDFLKGYTDILITDSDFGIGINIPDVKRSYHVGYPLSKNQFVQEAGRVARGHDTGETTILVKEKDRLDKVEEKLLNFNTPIAEVVDLVASFEQVYSDIIQAYKIIFGHVENPRDCIQKVMEIYNQFSNMSGRVTLFYYFSNTIKQNRSKELVYVENYLITLYNIGIIDEWFIDGESDKGCYYTVEINDKKANITYLKEKTLNYLRSLECSNSEAMQIKESTNITELILRYMDWYYENYLYHHREQYINMVEIVDSHINNLEVSSKDSLLNLFNVDYSNTENVREEILNSSIENTLKNEFFNRIKSYRGMINSCIEEQYSVKFDICLLWFDAINNSKNFFKRLERLDKKLSNDEKIIFVDSINELYSMCKESNKLVLLNYVAINSNNYNGIEKLYKNKDYDKEYYIILCKIINNKLGGRLDA